MIARSRQTAVNSLSRIAQPELVTSNVVAQSPFHLCGTLTPTSDPPKALPTIISSDTQSIGHLCKISPMDTLQSDIRPQRGYMSMSTLSSSLHSSAASSIVGTLTSSFASSSTLPTFPTDQTSNIHSVPSTGYMIPSLSSSMPQHSFHSPSINSSVLINSLSPMPALSSLSHTGSIVQSAPQPLLHSGLSLPNVVTSSGVYVPSHHHAQMGPNLINTNGIIGSTASFLHPTIYT
ncbi:unnamed protein product [Protopolystoma xenopodis]|uniref:Uncharacterized protein n=1 Tax=Protopolystoma xenopodis TaxID=117903 RepID=A0A3S4ZWB0_9PLAT|nr:unnamed protein product [Protopolystoma xenopodis]